MTPESCLARLRVSVEPAEGRARGGAQPASPAAFLCRRPRSGWRPPRQSVASPDHKRRTDLPPLNVHTWKLVLDPRIGRPPRTRWLLPSRAEGGTVGCLSSQYRRGNLRPIGVLEVGRGARFGGDHARLSVHSLARARRCSSSNFYQGAFGQPRAGVARLEDWSDRATL